MELRVLNYFLAIAREQSIVHAAESLHLSQPTLSTQIKNLEEELGKQLLIRGTKGSRKVTLTEEGMILRKRAEEILDLVRKTENEITASDDIIIGDIYIGSGETDGIRLIAKAAKALAEKYDVEMPIVMEVNKLLFENKPASEAVKDLMQREKQGEISWE